MSDVIVFKKELDGLVIFNPILKQGQSIETIAKRVVPKNSNYAIISSSEIPNDRSDRDLWDIDNSLLINTNS